MPVTTIDMADAAELTELLQLITGWLASNPATLGASLLKFIGHPAYGTQELQDDLHRFAFLLGCTDGEGLFGAPEGPLPPSRTRNRASARTVGAQAADPARRHATSLHAPRNLMTGNHSGAKTL